MMMVKRRLLVGLRVFLVPGRLRQEDYLKFKTSLGYIARSRSASAIA